MLKTKNLTQIFKNQSGSITAVNNVSLGFEKGNIYGIVGPNGAGKTTLIKLICGLIIPTSGEVYINETPLYPNNSCLLSGIGAILEGSRNIFWNFTPYQNVRYFALLKGLKVKEALVRALEFFDALDLTDKLHTPVRNLSQGMKQKIAIVISMLHNPEILLLDEPTLGLDPVSSRTMQTIIRDLTVSQKKIVVITSHQLNLMEKICDYIIFLDKGVVKVFDHIENFMAISSKKTYRFTVRLSAPNLPESLSEQIKNMTHTHDCVRFDMKTDEAELSSAIGLLSRENIQLIDIEKINPSLEEIFLKRVAE